MTQLLELTLDKSKINFSDDLSRLNNITILTGPNGSGKTRALTAIAYHYRYGQQASARLKVRGRPSRVIVQTFSPFSRFPAPTRSRNSLSDIYADERVASDNYRAIGIHRSLRHVGSSFSRHVLEQAIFRLSESVKQVDVTGRVLEYLSFTPKIKLVYKPKPAFAVVLSAARLQQLPELLSGEEQSGSVDLRTLLGQVRDGDLESVVELLSAAIESLGNAALAGPEIEFSMTFIGAAPSRSYAELQSLAVLRRFNLLQLVECILYKSDGERVELSYASSGQQQLLCSLFGLASEVRDDCLVLIDEPELSLHPKWQLSFISQLQQVLKAVSGCHVVIATHSPLVVQSAQEQLIEIMNLSISENDEPQAESVELRPSVEEALINIFETPIPHSLYLSNELIRIVSLVEREGPVVFESCRVRLEELKQVYGQSEEVHLIDRASGLINSSVSQAHG